MCALLMPVRRIQCALDKSHKIFVVDVDNISLFTVFDLIYQDLN